MPQTGSGVAAVFPFQVQYSVDGTTYSFLNYSRHTTSTVGANVTIAYDSNDPAKATLVGFTPAPKTTVSGSTRAAWQVIAALGFGLALRGLILLGELLARSRRELQLVTGPDRPFDNQDVLTDRQFRTLQRRGLPPTRSEVVLAVTLIVFFGALVLGVVSTV